MGISANTLGISNDESWKPIVFSVNTPLSLALNTCWLTECLNGLITVLLNAQEAESLPRPV